ncbi:MAG: helix-turn-helix domain-containing protein [Actinomycetota bacterium]|nr:helix-turn-helix domain-containing protein [Acidimicrobiia bacterium]MDQ3294516.1 helix-turn-helix domain-containing protein [Actinomycetota bacterium]
MPAEEPNRLDLLKTLGDNTRYAIYLELARSPVPLSTAAISDSLALHVNTVRPHLERMREVGLLDVAVDHTGGPGRPQHRYSLAVDAPSLGLEPPASPMLARMLLGTAARSGASPADAAAAGYAQGADEAAAARPGGSCTEALVGLLSRLGFDPARVDDVDGSTTVGFTHCPFRELAEANPDLVCALHRGLVTGFVDGLGGAEVAGFATLVDRHPCRVTLVEPA